MSSTSPARPPTENQLSSNPGVQVQVTTHNNEGKAVVKSTTPVKVYIYIYIYIKQYSNVIITAKPSADGPCPAPLTSRAPYSCTVPTDWLTHRTTVGPVRR